MNTRNVALELVGVIAVLFAGIQLATAQASPAGVPVSMVVTVEAHHGSDLPDISREDVMVYQGHTRAKVTDWVPLQSNRASLELYILIDDASNAGRGSQLDDLRRFIMAQPKSTKVGVAYMQISGPKVVQELTTDHELAAKALRVSLGNLAGSASPYFSLGDLIKHWPSGADRREILMISNGVDIDSDARPGRDDTYVDAAITQAQREGIVVYAIGTSGGGFNDIGSRQGGQGKNNLAQVADETGGELFYRESGAPVSFSPYLDTTTHRLAGQYLLTFLAKPGKKAELQSVKLKTEVPNAELVGADKVFVPANAQ